jgi:hypothetical protein
MTTFNLYRPRCTAVATLTSADRSVTVQVSLLEPGDGRPPRLRMTTSNRKLQVVGLSVGQAEGSVVEIDLSE